MDLIDDESFDQLSFDDRRSDLQHRFVSEINSPFGNRPYIAGKFKAAKVMQEIFTKKPLLRQIIEGGGIEGQGFEIFEHVLEAGGNEVAAVGRIGADKKTKRCLGHPLLAKIALRHGELVEIGKEGEIFPVGHGESSLSKRECSEMGATSKANGAPRGLIYRGCFVNQIMIIQRQSAQQEGIDVYRQNRTQGF